MENKILLRDILNLERFDAITGGYGSTELAVVGDLILDEFVWGEVSRISPEAPVPVVLVKNREYLLGGAGNVALNIKKLGGRPLLIAACGKDASGETIRRIIREEGLESFLTDTLPPTTTKTRVIARTQQVVRIDVESGERKSLPPGTAAGLEKILASRAARLGGIAVADYGKGFITRPVIDMLKGIKQKYGICLAVDPRPEHAGYYRHVTCMTPNRAEASMLLKKKEPADIRETLRLGAAIQGRVGCENLIVTLGKDGMLLLTGNADVRSGVFHIPSVAREVFDVTGAGDTVIAVFTLSLAVGASALEAAIIANLAAGITVGKLGTATASPDELRDFFKENSNSARISVY